MTLFRLDASIRIEGSASREIADLVEAEWLQAHPGDRVETRHLGVDPLPADAWAHAVSAGFVAEDQRTAEQAAAVKLAAGWSTSWSRPTRSCSPSRSTTSGSRST